PQAPSRAAVGKEEVLAAVDRARALLDAGRVTEAAAVLAEAVSAAAEAHGHDSAVVRLLRKQYAATLMENGQYRTALPELRVLAEDRAAQAGPADPQAVSYRFDAAQCLEHLGATADALAEYRALLPAVRQPGADPDLSLAVCHRTAGLLLATGDRAGARALLLRLLGEAERLGGPQHPLAVEARRGLDAVVL
ncbi:tetratricopeptide repeat protein, partial [Streptacidiphilus carbonis]|uniref:tetratricopeptide repeat protein n=1 Tax=Streptacidiphilus carbonis TaxID=105422 RepID=UPI0005A61187